MLVTHKLKAVSQFLDLIRAKNILMALYPFNRRKRVSSYDSGFEVRQWPEPAVLRGAVDSLIDNKGDEEPELGDLARDRLNIHTVDRIFDEV